MISKKELQHSISEARVKAQACADEVAAAQDRLAEAQREERLLVELAQLRGWSDDEFESLAAEPTADARANGTGETRRRTPSPMRTALLAAVIDVLNERGIGERLRQVARWEESAYLIHQITINHYALRNPRLNHGGAARIDEEASARAPLASLALLLARTRDLSALVKST